MNIELIKKRPNILLFKDKLTLLELRELLSLNINALQYFKGELPVDLDLYTKIEIFNQNPYLFTDVKMPLKDKFFIANQGTSLESCEKFMNCFDSGFRDFPLDIKELFFQNHVPLIYIDSSYFITEEKFFSYLVEKKSSLLYKKGLFDKVHEINTDLVKLFDDDYFKNFAYKVSYSKELEEYKKKDFLVWRSFFINNFDFNIYKDCPNKELLSIEDKLIYILLKEENLNEEEKNIVKANINFIIDNYRIYSYIFNFNEDAYQIIENFFKTELNS